MLILTTANGDDLSVLVETLGRSVDSAMKQAARVLFGDANGDIYVIFM